MIENAQARVRVNNLTTFTVINSSEMVGTTFLIENLSRAMRKRVLCHMRTTKPQISLRIRAVVLSCRGSDNFSLYDLTVQITPTSSECNSSIGFFSMRTNNLGRHETYGCWGKAIRTWRHWRALGQRWWYLRRGATPHKFTLNAWNVQSWKTTDSAWLPYKFHYWISNKFDPIAPVRVIMPPT